MAHPINTVGVDNTFRRKFNKEEYLQRAREREEKELEGQRKSKSKGSPLQRILLKHRDYEVDIDSRLGKTQVVTPIAQQAGYFCSACEYVSKDSENYVDHINGKKHQRAVGTSVRIERACLEQVLKQVENHKKRKDPGTFTEQNLDDRMEKQQQEEEERKRQKRERIKGKKEIEVDPDHDVASTMGFGGFGTSKGKKIVEKENIGTFCFVQS